MAKTPVKNTIKKHVFESYLEKGNVLLHINPKVKEPIVLPSILDETFNVVLCIGHSTPYPIPDLNLTDEGIEATLTANHEPFTCFIPWSSIYYMGLLGELGYGWPSDAPLAIFHHWHIQLGGPPEEIRENLEKDGVDTVYEDGEYQLKKKHPFSIINGDGAAVSDSPPSSHFLTLLTPSDN